MKTTTLLYSLFVLVTLDFITTFIGIECMGATELNPLYYYFPSLLHWLSFKFFVGVVCLYAIIRFYNSQQERIINIGLYIINIFYCIVIINNIIQIGLYL